jgi:hypothetical protein
MTSLIACVMQVQSCSQLGAVMGGVRKAAHLLTDGLDLSLSLA